jgi:predicted MPP superfamily phosphohydrolase
LCVGHTPLWVGGVDEPHQHRADPAAVLAEIPAHDPVLLLAHSPEVLECPFPRSPALILAGHTHGGQIRIPWLSPLVTHTRVPLPAYQGLIATAQGPMHISPGIGASIPLRFRCPPEVTTLVLRAAPG